MPSTSFTHKLFCFPGVFFLLTAFVLSVIVSVSLPAIPSVDIVRTQFLSGTVDVSGIQGNANQLRFGIWSYCAYVDGERSCVVPGYGYSVDVLKGGQHELIGASWTRGLSLHPVVTVAVFLTLLTSLSSNLFIMLMTILFALLAALLALIAFAIDLALYAFVNDLLGNFTDQGASSHLGPGFWINFVILLLILLSACTVCLGRRHKRAHEHPTEAAVAVADSKPAAAEAERVEKPGVFGRVFKRNKDAAGATSA